LTCGNSVNERGIAGPRSGRGWQCGRSPPPRPDQGSVPASRPRVPDQLVGAEGGRDPITLRSSGSMVAGARIHDRPDEQEVRHIRDLLLGKRSQHILRRKRLQIAFEAPIRTGPRAAPPSSAARSGGPRRRSTDPRRLRLSSNRAGRTIAGHPTGGAWRDEASIRAQDPPRLSEHRGELLDVRDDERAEHDVDRRWPTRRRVSSTIRGVMSTATTDAPSSRSHSRWRRRRTPRRGRVCLPSAEARIGSPVDPNVRSSGSSRRARRTDRRPPGTHTEPLRRGRRVRRSAR
jgi:hypothetical protein